MIKKLIQMHPNSRKTMTSFNFNINDIFTNIFHKEITQISKLYL